MLLALDASISSTGYAVMKENSTLIEIGKLTTTSKETEEKRIFKIVNSIKDIIKNNEVNVVIMESQFLGRNVKTAMQLSRLRGAVMFVCMSLNVELIHLTPSEIRSCLFNKGSADKKEVAEYIKTYYLTDTKVQALGEFNDRQCKAKNSDIYDAISIGLAHINKCKEGL